MIGVGPHLNRRTSLGPNPICAKVTPGYIGLFCTKGLKHQSYTLDEMLTFPDPSKPLSLEEATDDAGFEFAWLVNWGCMPKQEEVMEYTHAILAQEVSSFSADHHAFSRDKVKLSEQTSHQIYLLSRDWLQAGYTEKKAEEMVWKALREKYSKDYVSTSLFGQCYNSSWWEESLDMGHALTAYPNGTHMSNADMDFVHQLGPRGGKGWPVNSKYVFCACASRGVDTLEAHVAHPTLMKWVMMAITVFFGFFTLLAETYLICIDNHTALSTEEKDKAIQLSSLVGSRFGYGEEESLNDDESAKGDPEAAPPQDGAAGIKGEVSAPAVEPSKEAVTMPPVNTSPPPQPTVPSLQLKTPVEPSKEAVTMPALHTSAPPQPTIPSLPLKRVPATHVASTTQVKESPRVMDPDGTKHGFLTPEAKAFMSKHLGPPPN